MSGNLSEELVQLLNSNQVVTFLNAANNFIELLETDGLTGKKYYEKTHLALLALYVAGINLPDVDLIYSDNETDFDDGKLFHPQKELDISGKLGKDSVYLEVFDPIHPDKDEPTQGWLVDDYDAVYTDIKREIQKIKIGTNEAVKDALWELNFGFLHHWGNHCINALRALHYLKYHDYKF